MEITENKNNSFEEFETALDKSLLMAQPITYEEALKRKEIVKLCKKRTLNFKNK